MFLRDLRLRLWREHPDRPADGSEDEDLLDPECAVRAISRSAEALEAWYNNGRPGVRPPGRLRPHKPARPTPLTRLWAVPPYRLIYDPDGRS